MKLYHVTVNGKQVDVAASNIRVAVNRGIDKIGLSAGDKLSVEANLSNHGDVYQWTITPVKARTTEYGFYRVQGHEWVQAGGGSEGFFAGATQAYDRFVKLSSSQAWAPEATHLILTRFGSKGRGDAISIEGRA